jgi:plastocyanin
MEVQRFIIIGSAFILLTGCQHSLVRGSMPTITRTGEVKDIVIKQSVSPVTVAANPGDEIRWINKREGDVEVTFLTPMMDRLACQRNFGAIMGEDRNQYSAKIETNDTAGVCFRDPIRLTYVVKAESSDPSGEDNLPGSIIIDSESRLAK